MSQPLRTILTITAAAALAALAWLTAPAPPRSAQLAEIGEPFFPGFTDPTAATSLEVIAYDEDSARHRAFKVQFRDGRWIIPSNSDYPVDNANKLAEAAAAFIGLRRESLVSNQSADHTALQVMPPDDDTAPSEGRGVRVTLRDAQDRTLTDLIIGRAPDGPPETSVEGDKRYVRIPSENAVYTTTLGAGFSTKFIDWIDTDLLRLRIADVSRAVFDRYSVDEGAGVHVDGPYLAVSRLEPLPGKPRFALEARPDGAPAEGETTNDTRIDQALRDLVGLRIIGAVPKPASLATLLAGQAGDSATLDSADLLTLAARGFYLAQGGRLLANDGEIRLTTTTGLVYTIWLGEARVADDAAQAVSLQPDPAPTTPQESRFVFVTVEFSEDALPPEPESPAPQTQPAPESQAPADPPAEPQPSPQRLRAIEDGKAKAAELNRRFADWFFLVDAGVVDRLRVTRADFVKPIEPPAPEVPAPSPPG